MAIETWGDFLLVGTEDEMPAVEVRPAPAAETPDLHGMNPIHHDWTVVAADIATARNRFPQDTRLPTIENRSDVQLRHLFALVNPRSDEVVEVQGWYDLPDSDPEMTDPKLGTADLLTYWGRRFSLPRVRRWNTSPLQVGTYVARKPIEKVRVGATPGVYISFDLIPGDDPAAPTSLRDMRIRDAVQWTDAEGRFWTVQGFLPRADLVDIASHLAAAG